MKNGSTPASPIEFKSAPNLSGNVSIEQWSGMTKREEFAMAAMQGLCAGNIENRGTYEDISIGAVLLADLLLEELSK